MKEKINLHLCSLPFIGERKYIQIYFHSRLLGRENKLKYIFTPVLSGRENVFNFIFSFTLGPSYILSASHLSASESSAQIYDSASRGKQRK